ncbi:hypothetical protein K1719_027593 [Acacia pycnantha]|nr:hypothetical protein K1719_027593 [Acacia pycnantha]
MSPSNGFQNGGAVGGGLNYIEHRVSKLDTLAGVAIKYGVEVADVKKMNGLATDLQMFAMKTLRIPLPGRHPPSSSQPNGSAKSRDNSPDKRPTRMGQSEQVTSNNQLTGILWPEILKSQGKSEETEMAVYSSAGPNYFSREEWRPKASPMSDLPPDLLTGDSVVPEYVPLAEIGDGGCDKSDEKSVRRRQKPEVDSGAGILEKLLKEENNGGASGFSSSTGKGLALRPKSASRTQLLSESESGPLDSIPIGLGESIMFDGLSTVHKSSSTSSLREQEKNNSVTVWPTGWSLKPDFQALSTATIAKPIFDGLPNPITGRRSKAALD